MFQDIAPHTFRNSFSWNEEVENKLAVVYHRGKILLQAHDDTLFIPTRKQVKDSYAIDDADFIYLFSVDKTGFYLCLQSLAETEGFVYRTINHFRNTFHSWYSFAGATAMHLGHWYESHQYCGRCSAEMEHSKSERAMKCPACGEIVYPRISPVVIIGVTDGNRLLLSKYAGREYANYALLAGFVEIGETLEEAVQREVMEEVGIPVQNIRYYKSQPWAFSESLLMGFFAEAAENTPIRLDQEELSEAAWFERNELPSNGDSSFSLTWNMIDAFRKGER